MSTVVVSFRIPKKLKERMDKLCNVNWSEEVRRFLEERVSEIEAAKAIERLKEHLSDVPELPPGTAARWVRSDRDSR